jgi:outer membrane protein assembly factor BamB
MIYSMRCVSIVLFTAGLLMAQTGKNVWNAELDDDVKKVQPVLNGKYLFLSSDEYAWLYENATGKKVWSVEVDDFSENAIHQVVNDSLYLVANDDTLYCYDMLHRSVLWKRIYPTVEQSKFSGLQQLDTLLVLSFTTLDLGISLADGKEAWRQPVEYDRSLTERGTVNALMLSVPRKYFVFTDYNECLLISAETGKKLLTIPASEPHGDLIKQKREWYYYSPEQNFAAFLFEKNFIVVNTETNKLMAQIPLKVSDQYNPLVPTSVGCAVVGEDRIVHLNAKTGKTSQVPVNIDAVRYLSVAQTDSAAVMVVGVEDKVIGWNLDIGKSAWQTPLKFQPSNGFIHRFITQDSGNVIVTYVDPSQDVKLYLMSLNAWTGKINYRTLVAHSDESLPKRSLPLPVTGPFTGPVQPSFGFENIGFQYQATAENGNVVFIIRSDGDMMVPNTEKQGGEGFVRVDITNGQVLSKNYVKIVNGLSFNGGMNALAGPKTSGNLVFIPGNKNLVTLDATTGALRWMLIEQDLKGSYILDMAIVDTVLYVRTGGMKMEYKYDAKKDKLSQDKLWEEDDYTLVAVDTATGKVLWKREFEMDPGRVFHSYSVERYVKGAAQIFFADEKFLYSASLDPMKKGMLTWKFEFSDSGTGNMDYDDLTQRSRAWKHEPAATPEEINEGRFPLKEGTVAGESFTTFLSKVLHVEYDRTDDRIYIFGDDGIAAVNTTNGRKVWFYEWDYNAKALHQRPVRLNGSIFYVIDGQGVLLNSATGKVTATVKVDKESGVFIMPDRSSVVIIDKDEVTGIAIP